MSETSHIPTTPDNTGGLRIQDFSERELSLGHERLQAVDLIQARALETLRITEKAPSSALHLMIDGLPNLTRMDLPECDSGAVLHLADQKPPNGLQIEGPVAQIDGDWQSVRFCMEKEPSKPPWQRVRVVAPEQVHELRAGHGLVIVVGQPESESQTLHLSQGDDWLLLGTASLQHLQIDTPGRVCVQDASGLTTINGNAEETILDVVDAPGLKRVSGTGQYLSVRREGPSAKRLTIAGNWAEANLRCTHLEELNFPNARALTLYYCERLKSVELPLGVPTDCYGSVPDSLLEGSRLFMDESTLKRHLDSIRSGDQSHLKALLRVLAHRYKRDEVVTALRSLSELCEAGVEADSIWRTRQELLARQLKRPNRKRAMELTRGEYQRAAKRWSWDLPEDLAQEALVADLAIWRYCRKACESAKRSASVFAKQGCSVTYLSALIRHAMQPDAARIDQQVMAKALQNTAESHEGKRLTRSREGRALAKRLEWLVRMERVEHKTQQAILDLLTAGLRVSQLKDVFGRLMAYQPTEIRMRAIRLAHAGDRWIRETFGLGANPQKLRSTFLQLALRPQPEPATKEAQ